MNIQLYNIPAISVTNELYFASSADRETILSNYRVASLTQAYYPVQYTNKIKFSTDNVPFSTVFNYLSIEMYGKKWYYFVDNFEYTNEKIYYVNIVIDSVQTFYFDINFRRFEKSRKFGFSGLRDNISMDSTLYPVSFEDYDYNKPFVVVVQYNTRLAFNECRIINGADNDLQPVSQQANFDWENLDNNRIIKNVLTTYTDGLKTLFLPIPYQSYQLLKFINPSGNETIVKMNRETVFDTLRALANDPNVVNMYVTRILPQGVSVGTVTVNNVPYSAFILSSTCQVYTNWLVKTGTTYETTDFTIVQHINRTKYGTLTTPSRAVCDSNYTQIAIGELNDYVIVPIELLEPETTYDLYCTLDISSGARVYEVDAEPLQKIKFKHICNSIESLALFNDNYNTFLLQNKGTLTTGVALQKTQAWVNFFNQVFNQNAAKSFSGAMQGGVAGGIVSGVESSVTSGVDLFMSMYSIDKSVQAQKENAYYAPDTIKSGNNFTNDIIHDFFNRIVMITKVADCDDIENIRNYTGYLCHDTTYNQTMNELITDTTSVSGKTLIMGECELYLTAFNTATYLADIKNRFKAGIRFYSSVADLGK